MSKTFRVLSIDGGGALGIYPATILKLIETEILCNAPIINSFNLITGTSTGGLIALSLASEHSVEEIIEFYREKSKIIFPNDYLNFFRIINSLFIRSMYRQKPLKNILEEHFGKKTMADLKTPVCITAVDTVQCHPIVYKTKNAPHLKRDENELLVDIALATSSAPIFFPTYKFSHYRSVVDGGIWQNNPSMVGLIEANTNFLSEGSDFESVSILSIGNPLSNQISSYINGKMNISSLFSWGKKLVTLPMKVSSNGIDLQMKMIQRNHALKLHNYLRIASGAIPSDLKHLSLTSSSDSKLKKIETQAINDFHLEKSNIIEFFKL
jgi:patatin-like phospholipase/acyl hydrolase